jgi:hypothetical protein
LVEQGLVVIWVNAVKMTNCAKKVKPIRKIAEEGREMRLILEK